MFEPERSLFLAIRPTEQSRCEETLSAVIGRAYYAAFLSVRVALGMTKGLHVPAWSRLEKIDVAAAGLGHRLRRLRDNADYCNPIAEPEEEARTSTADASLLIAFAKTLQPHV